MRELAAFSSGFLFLLPLLAAGASPSSLLPDGTVQRRLDNGLKVVVVPLGPSGIVAVQTWVDVGAGDEASVGSTGLAHFFEHLLFHGSVQLPREAREDRLQELGAEDNAWTSKDFTCYHLEARADGLERLLEIEADRFENLDLVEAAVRREAGAVAGEVRKARSNPARALVDALWDLAYDVHPYGHSVLGLDADVAAMPEGTSRAEAFHATWYRPERVGLVIAGDVEPEAALATVERTFGTWRADPSAAAPVAAPAEPEPSGPRRLDLVWTEGPAAPRLAVAWRIPAFVPGDRDTAALEVAHDLLASRNAPLVRALVEQQSLAWRVGGDGPEQRQPGLFTLVVDLREPGGVEPALAGIEAAVRELAVVEEARVLAAREHRARQLVLGLDSPAAWASTVGFLARVGGDAGALDREVRALGEVTPEDLRRVAAAWLVDSRRSVVSLVQEQPGEAP